MKRQIITLVFLILLLVKDDVLWVKRVRKFIDIRITQNHPLYFPISVAYSDYNGWDGVSMESGSGGQKIFNEVLSGTDAEKTFIRFSEMLPQQSILILVNRWFPLII